MAKFNGYTDTLFGDMDYMERYDDCSLDSGYTSVAPVVEERPVLEQVLNLKDLGEFILALKSAYKNDDFTVCEALIADAKADENWHLLDLYKRVREMPYSLVMAVTPAKLARCTELINSEIC